MGGSCTLVLDGGDAATADRNDRGVDEANDGFLDRRLDAPHRQALNADKRRMAAKGDQAAS
jgi:hypothetical protein